MQMLNLRPSRKTYNAQENPGSWTKIHTKLGAMTYEVLINILYKLCLYKVKKDCLLFFPSGKRTKMNYLR